jgi:uncharacterized protein involved in exopolysaccharide biosynthesis
MEFYRIWRILVGNKWVLIWLPIIATCVGVAVTYVLPEQYESTALVLVRPIEDVKFDTSVGDQKGMLDFPVNLSAPIDAPSKTYMEVIKSRAVAVKIVDALELYVETPKTYDSLWDTIKGKARIWVNNTIRTVRNYAKYGRDIPASPYDLAVENVEQKLVVSPKKDTYAFGITYLSSDPKAAAAVANTAAEIFLAQRSEAYRSEAARTRKFIEKQVDESRKALEEARAETLAYKNSSEIFELNTEYTQKLKDLSSLETMVAESEGKLAGLKRPNPNVVEQQAEIAGLKQQISMLRAQLALYPTKEARMSALILAQRLAQESYEFFLKRYEEARVKEAADVTEIRVASPAVPSLYPVKPLKYVYAALSFAMALVLAIGWVLLSESVDPRVRTTRDLEEEPGVPVLGAIPTLKHHSWRVGT